MAWSMMQLRMEDVTTTLWHSKGYAVHASISGEPLVESRKARFTLRSQYLVDTTHWLCDLIQISLGHQTNWS